MSGLGLLATALAGGAREIGKQAGDDLEAQRKAEFLKQQADIQEQMQMRLADAQARRDRQSNLDRMGDTRDFGASDATIAAADKVAQAAGKTARGVKLAELSDEGLNTASRTKAAADARAASETERELIKAKAGDKDYIKSFTTLKLADPEVRAHIAQMNAAAGASAASVRESTERLKQLADVGQAAKAVRGLQSQLSNTTDPEARKAIEQQITDMGFSGKDTKSFLSTAERAMSNGDAAMKILLDPGADEVSKDLARKQLERANSFADQAASLAGIKTPPKKDSAGPAVGTEVNGYVFNGGNPNDKANWTVKGSKPKGGGMLSTPSLKPADDMAGITFAGDGYKANGQTYPTLSEAKAAKAEAESKQRAGQNAMSRSLTKYGDD